MKPVAFDVECYVDYFLAVFKTEDGKTYSISKHNDVLDGDIKTLRAVYRKHPIISFNGEHYDTVLLSAFMAGWSNAELKALSDTIIVEGLPRWKLTERYPNLRILNPAKGHIDLIGSTPLQASLKAYGCRIHSRKLQDLPIEPDASISESDAAVLEQYCVNDVDVTWDIYRTMLPQLNLRASMTRDYGMDMRSKSDPQIAEMIIKHYMLDKGHSVEKREGAVKPFKYKVPPFIKFYSETLQNVLEAVRGCTFTVKDTGNVQLPDEISQVIEFADAKYKLGIGGLHSQEKRQCVSCDYDYVLGELDVASFYPSIILGQGLYPEHLGEEFIDVYREIFTTRIAAKNSGNKTVADTLKIVLNASYGKFGSKYSFLYSPELLIQTTLTGQLALLMLIERLDDVGVDVISANTDGVVVHTPKARWEAVERVWKAWTNNTSYVLEWTAYDDIYARDVNSYIAFKGDEVKTKGVFEYGSIRKGYSNEVCIDAVIEYLRCGTPLEETISSCDDIRKFLTMRGVRGGAIWRDQELGKVVRWYMAEDGEPIRYKNNGNKVAGSDNAIPLMDIDGTSLSQYDVHHPLYVAHAVKLLGSLGIKV